MELFPNGGLDTMMDRLSVAMERISPGWSETLKPASPEEIEAYRLAAHAPRIPLAYRLFLERAGNGDGGLLEKEWDGCSQVDLPALMEKGDPLEAFQEFSDESDPRRFLLFSTHWTESDLYLDLDSGGEDPPVFLFARDLHSGSFQNYLFQMAFQQLVWDGFLCRIADGSSKLDADWFLRRHLPGYARDPLGGTPRERMETARPFLDPYPLEPLWFSDDTHHCLMGEDLAVHLDTTWALNFTVAGRDKAQVEEIANFLLRAMRAPENKTRRF